MSTADAYRQIFDRRSPDEVRTLARIKRFMELLVGDPAFRAALREAGGEAGDGDYAVIARAHGVEVDPAQMLPLFHTGYMKYRHTPEEARWPLSLAWSTYMKEMVGHRDAIRESGTTGGLNPAFDTWRARQMARADTELGVSSRAITHPIVAYELSDGCTVGCWFCGLSAERFKGAWPYTPETAALWRGVLQAMVDLFGPAAQTGFCYWATDPMDNPDYDRFIADHWEITGFLPQTTTAAPLKDVALTRRVLALFDQHRCVTNRFSILTTKMLRRVHETFTPDELMGVELIPQMKDAIATKADAGRARDRKATLRAAGRDDKVALLDADHATIACVSGFLISMPNQTVRMVAPARAGETWPLGYRVYDEGRFETAAGFRALVEGMVARHGGERLQGDDVLAFRPDLTWTPSPEGFVLTNGASTTKVCDPDVAPPLGRLLAAGDRTAGDIHVALIEQGCDVFRVAHLIQDLYARGLLDDDPASGRIGAARAARSEFAAAGA